MNADPGGAYPPERARKFDFILVYPFACGQ